ncbi:MAG: NAD(P)-binding protein [Acidobacteria bacterium]|nr:NAD(P)-binding protein [Acidobacteriota bacterium]
MAKIAIIGTGIAGMACGHFLTAQHELTFYEKNDYVGGHTNTITVDEAGVPVRIDTGFIVYNLVTYPNLVRLFDELQVETVPSSMSFSVNHQPSGLEYCGSGLNGLFAQRRNLLNPGFVRLLLEINRFNNECPKLLDSDPDAALTLTDYARKNRYSASFLEKYLLPMSSAIWSTEPDVMLGFPAVTLARFFKNHGLLGLNGHYQWRTVKNGSWSYRDKLIAPFRERILTRRAAVAVTRSQGQAVVTDSEGQQATYDKVILACHADQALALLCEPTETEARLLRFFRYQTNRAALHSDESVMPMTRRTWSAWNYRLDYDSQQTVPPTTVYYMNRLQPLNGQRNYFVSINESRTLDAAKIHYETVYEHPVFSAAAIQAQKELPQLNKNGVTYFCGSYFKYGFHEDALTSALDVCRALTGERLWG